MENNPETPATHLLDDFDYQYVQANANTRFCNLLVDRLISYLIIATFNVCYFAIIEFATGGKTVGKLFTRTRAVMANGQRLTPKAAFLRAISQAFVGPASPRSSSSQPSLRSVVPFEPFSAFGKPSYPWHDRWSGTLVIDENQTQLPPW